MNIDSDTSLSSQDKYICKCTVWCMGVLKEVEKMGFLSLDDLPVTISNRGVSEFDQIYAEIQPSEEDIMLGLQVLVVTMSGHDKKEAATTLFPWLMLYRHNKAQLEAFSERNKGFSK